MTRKEKLVVNWDLSTKIGRGHKLTLDDIKTENEYGIAFDNIKLGDLVRVVELLEPKQSKVEFINMVSEFYVDSLTNQI